MKLLTVGIFLSFLSFGAIAQTPSGVGEDASTAGSKSEDCCATCQTAKAIQCRMNQAANNNKEAPVRKGQPGAKSKTGSNQ